MWGRGQRDGGNRRQATTEAAKQVQKAGGGGEGGKGEGGQFRGCCGSGAATNCSTRNRSAINCSGSVQIHTNKRRHTHTSKQTHTKHTYWETFSHTRRSATFSCLRKSTLYAEVMALNKRLQSSAPRTKPENELGRCRPKEGQSEIAWVKERRERDRGGESDQRVGQVIMIYAAWRM